MTAQDFYSASKDDLYFPCRRGDFFVGGLPKSEAALCAEIARLAYCRKEPDFTFDQDKIRSVLGNIGFAECQFVESKTHARGQGTHAFVALKRDDEMNPQLAVVAFRGTDKDDPTDVGNDADAMLIPWKDGGKVHQGFARALDEIQPQIEIALRVIQCKTLFTGHSLGAALATLLASRRKPNLLCTIGSPRVGNADFVATLREVESQRFVDCCDLVPRVPLDIMGYEHVGAPYYIARNRKLTLNPSEEFVRQDRIQAEAEYLLKYAWKIGNAGVRALADHAPVNYVSPITANQSVL